MAADTTTDIETDTPTYVISKSQNRQIAALHHIASRDSVRETLRGIRITYSDEKLTFTVTDSFAMVERTYDISHDNIAPRDLKNHYVKQMSGDDSGVVMVNAVALRDALNTIRTALLSKLEVGTSGVTVSTEDTSITIPALSGQYPDTDRLWNDNPPTDPYESEYMALNARYLWDLSRSTGRNPKAMGPLVLRGSTKLKPVHITMPGEAGWRGLVMPVKL